MHKLVQGGMVAATTYLHNGMITQLYERLKLRYDFRDGMRNRTSPERRRLLGGL